MAPPTMVRLRLETGIPTWVNERAALGWKRSRGRFPPAPLGLLQGELQGFAAIDYWAKEPLKACKGAAAGA